MFRVNSARSELRISLAKLIVQIYSRSTYGDRRLASVLFDRFAAASALLIFLGTYLTNV